MQYTFERLQVWNTSMKITQIVYELSKRFPSDERFGLTNQMRRAAVSISLNLAEGSGRSTKKDFANFVRIAIGSTLEVVTCTKIAVQQKMLSSEVSRELEDSLQELYFKLIGLDKSLRQ